MTTHTPATLKKTRSALRGLLITTGMSLSLALAGCQGTAEPPQWKTILETGDSDVVPSKLEVFQTSPNLVVYLDMSPSMRGFISSGKEESVLSRTLQELRGLSLNPPVEIWMRRVGAEIGHLQATEELILASRTQAAFNEQYNDLAKAVQYFSPPIFGGGLVGGPAGPVTSQADPQALENASLPARFHILVTDGVHSVEDKVGGSDQVNLQRNIRMLLEQGWSGSILGVRSQFSGDIYSEMNALLKRKGLNQAVPPTAPAYTSGSDPTRYRPFYVYVFSPDPGALEGLIRQLKHKLQVLNPNTGAVYELPLGCPLTKSGDPALVEFSSSGFEIEKSKSSELGPARLTVKTEPGQTNLTFSVTVSKIPWSDSALNLGSPQELTTLLTWETAQVYPKAGKDQAQFRYPKLILVNPAKPDSQGKQVLEWRLEWPKSTDPPAWRVYRATGHLNPEADVPAWVRDWSTQNDEIAENGNRTYGLDKSLAGLWKSAALKKQPVVELYLRIGPK
ncbi:MAG: hypothetical protein HY774_08695 [Acidobacteria bacterium]|nr:hypothetical protein [Acidobacteriota bacterium]